MSNDLIYRNKCTTLRAHNLIYIRDTSRVSNDTWFEEWRNANVWIDEINLTGRINLTGKKTNEICHDLKCTLFYRTLPYTKNRVVIAKQYFEWYEIANKLEGTNTLLYYIYTIIYIQSLKSRRSTWIDAMKSRSVCDMCAFCIKRWTRKKCKKSKKQKAKTPVLDMKIKKEALGSLLTHVSLCRSFHIFVWFQRYVILGLSFPLGALSFCMDLLRWSIDFVFFAFFNAEIPWQEMVSLLKLLFIFPISPLLFEDQWKIWIFNQDSTKSEVQICPSVMVFMHSDP